MIKNLSREKILLIIIIVLACFFRILFFSYARPFWNDECTLALNVMETWNYFKPLEYNQAAPQLFLYFSKIMYNIFPNKEFALRLLPLLSSIASIFIFYFFCNKYFIKRFTALTATAVFALCYTLCYYAQEFKQYSSDIMVFLLILSCPFYLDKIKTLKQKILFGTLCAILIWLSFSAAFALFAVLVVLLFDTDKFKKYAPAYIPVLISLGLFYIASRHLNSNEYLHTYWQQGFINKGFLEFFKLTETNVKFIFSSVTPLIFIVVSIFLTILHDRKNVNNLLVFVPVGLILVLSYFSIYPFLTRVMLFLTPIFIILSVKLFDYIDIKNKIWANITNGILILILLYPMVLNCVYFICLKQYEYEDIVTPLKFISKKADPKAIVYISVGNKVLYEYYKNFIKITNPVKFEEQDYYDDEKYLKQLEDNCEKGKTYYWVYAHHPRKVERLKAVYFWAKTKKDFRLYADDKQNAIVAFTM